MAQYIYKIQVEGHLGDSWSPWLEGMTIHRKRNGQTVLSGPLPDEPALHGVLTKIRDLGLPLVQITRCEAEHKIADPKEESKA